MKDAYSFDRDREGLDVSYQKMFEAYERIFRRVGLDDPGRPGGSRGHWRRRHSRVYGARRIRARPKWSTAPHASMPRTWKRPRQASRPRKIRGREAADGAPACKRSRPRVCGLLRSWRSFSAYRRRQMIKTLIYKADEPVVAVLVRGDREVNELKLARALGVRSGGACRRGDRRDGTGAPVGFAGPVGLDGLTIVADLEVPSIHDGITGANKADTHLRHVAYGRDYRADLVADVASSTSRAISVRSAGDAGVRPGHRSGTSL